MTKQHRQTQTAPVRPHASPEAYKHIRAWGQCLASSPDYIRHQQELAAQDGAPLDAIFLHSANGQWHTYEQVTNSSTREKLDAILARMGKK